MNLDDDIVYSVGQPPAPVGQAPVFNDLKPQDHTDVAKRVGLLRAVEMIRAMAAQSAGDEPRPPRLVISHVADLPDPWDQRIVAVLLQSAGTDLVIDGQAVDPHRDDHRDAVVEVLERFAGLNPLARIKGCDGPSATYLVAQLRFTGGQAAWVINRALGNDRTTPQLVAHHAAKNEQFRTVFDHGGPDYLMPFDSIRTFLDQAGTIHAVTEFGMRFNDDAPQPDDPLLHAGLVAYSETLRKPILLPGHWDQPQIRPSQRELLEPAMLVLSRVVRCNHATAPWPAGDRHAARKVAVKMRSREQTTQAIADELNRRGFRTRRTGTWHRSAVTALLESEKGNQS